MPVDEKSVSPTVSDESPAETVEKDVIAYAPQRQAEMQLTTPTREEQNLQPTTGRSSESSSDSSRNDSYSESEVGSGYERDGNECTEFCIEFAGCFGMCDTCCPSSGEGFLTTAATVCGNMIVGCIKC